MLGSDKFWNEMCWNDPTQTHCIASNVGQDITVADPWGYVEGVGVNAPLQFFEEVVRMH